MKNRNRDTAGFWTNQWPFIYSLFCQNCCHFRKCCDKRNVWRGQTGTQHACLNHNMADIWDHVNFEKLFRSVFFVWRLPQIPKRSVLTAQKIAGTDYSTAKAMQGHTGLHFQELCSAQASCELLKKDKTAQRKDRCNWDYPQEMLKGEDC